MQQPPWVLPNTVIHIVLWTESGHECKYIYDWTVNKMFPSFNAISLLLFHLHHQIYPMLLRYNTGILKHHEAFQNELQYNLNQMASSIISNLFWAFLWFRHTAAIKFFEPRSYNSTKLRATYQIFTFHSFPPSSFCPCSTPPSELFSCGPMPATVLCILCWVFIFFFSFDCRFHICHPPPPW